MEQLALPYAIVTWLWPDTSAPKAVRGQRRLSTLAEALPLAREIGAMSRALREITLQNPEARSEPHYVVLLTVRGSELSWWLRGSD